MRVNTVSHQRTANDGSTLLLVTHRLRSTVKGTDEVNKYAMRMTIARPKLHPCKVNTEFRSADDQQTNSVLCHVARGQHYVNQRIRRTSKVPKSGVGFNFFLNRVPVQHAAL